MAAAASSSGISDISLSNHDGVSSYPLLMRSLSISGIFRAALANAGSAIFRQTAIMRVQVSLMACVVVKNFSASDRNRRRSYTRGELNRLIDSIWHPPAKLNPELLIIDWIFHVIVEQDLSEPTVEFIQYNLPRLMSQCCRRT